MKDVNEARIYIVILKQRRDQAGHALSSYKLLVAIWFPQKKRV